MSNVIDMSDLITENMTPQKRAVWERGGDVMVSFRSGVYTGRLSEAPADCFQKIESLLNRIERELGGTFSGAVGRVIYDDKSDTDHTVHVYEGLAAWLDAVEIPGQMELIDSDCMIWLNVDLAPDSLANELIA